MASNRVEVPAVLTEQCEHQLRVVRRRRVPWILGLFVVGLVVSIVGVVPSTAWSLERGTPTPGAFVFSFFVLYFGSALVIGLLPIRPRPRIVPYFRRGLGDYGGATSAAFKRGRGLYREMAVLDRLAGSLGVKPLTTFGFAYDHFEQEVRWHPASEGLRSVEALRQGAERSLEGPDVAEDLEALASVMRAAVDQGVDFSLVLRLHEKDSLQAVCTMEERQGSFW